MLNLQTIGSLDWRTIIFGIAVTWVMRYGLPWLKAQAEAAEALTKKNNVDKATSILAHMEDFLYTIASSTIETEFPSLAQSVVSGQVTTPAQVEAVIQSWNGNLKTEVINYFQNQGIDLVSEVGDSTIDKFVSNATNHASPFPANKTSTAIFNDMNAEKIVVHGVHTVRQQSLSECRACLPPCNDCPIRRFTAEKDLVNEPGTTHSVKV